MRVAAPLLFIAALVGLSHGALAILWSASNSGVCPYGSVQPDGCTTAPYTGSFQNASYMTGYTFRPAWNVAGVDYAVGVPQGASLTSWSTASVPTGWSRGLGSAGNYGNWTCTAPGGNNQTVDLIDFSATAASGARGAVLFLNTCTGITITRSKFGGVDVDADVNPPIVASGANGLTISWITMSMGCSGSGLYGPLIGAGGALSVTYSYFVGYPDEVIGSNGGATQVTAKYNYIGAGACTSGSHLNYLQTGSALSSGTFNVSFNTSYQDTEVASGEGWQFYSNSGGSVTSVTADRNTMVAKQTGASVAMSYLMHPTADTAFGTTLTSGTITNNYVDISGAFGFLYTGNSSCTNTTSSGNINMVSGAAINPC